MKLVPLLLACVPALGFDGNGEGRGGGDVFVCREERNALLRPFLGSKQKTYLADTYSLIRGEQKTAFQDFERIRGGQYATIHGLIALVGVEDSFAAPFLKEAIANFRWIADSDLRELDDDNIHDVPAGCEKRQLAVQDVHKGVIRYHPDRLRSLSALEYQLFLLHEGWIAYRARFEKETQDTRGVRLKVSALAESGSFREFVSRVAAIARGDQPLVRGAVKNWVASIRSGNSKDFDEPLSGEAKNEYSGEGGRARLLDILPSDERLGIKISKVGKDISLCKFCGPMRLTQRTYEVSLLKDFSQRVLTLDLACEERFVVQTPQIILAELQRLPMEHISCGILKIR